jgi:hypothetical protein
MDGELVREQPPLGDLHRIDVSDQVGDRGIGRRELFGVARVPVDPRDLGVVAALGHDLPRIGGDRPLRFVQDLAALDHGDPLVEQTDEGANHARLRLPPLTEEDQVVSAEQGVLQRGDHRFLVSDDAGKERRAALQLRQEIRAQLVAHGSRPVAGGAQLAQCLRCRSARCHLPSHLRPAPWRRLIPLPSGSGCGVG